MFSAINRKAKRWVLRHQKRRPFVFISDTTLRDGAQMPGVSLDSGQRVAIAKALAAAGVHSLDIGMPAAGKHECDAIRQVARSVKGPVLSVLARSMKEDVDLAGEVLAGISPLKRAVTIFIGTGPLHRKHKLGLSKAQVIKAAVEAIDYAQRSFEIISFGAEDASRTETDFLHEIYEEAIQAGAISIGFTDTVGILTPHKAADAVRRIQDEVASMDDAMLAVHFHNDLGLATANSLACVTAGANVVQGTVNGIGERAGNVALEEIVMALVLHPDEYGKQVSVDPAALYELSRFVSQTTGVPVPHNKAVVGDNMFRTEAGVHQDGMLQHPGTYLPFPPEMIGAKEVEFVLGRHSGSNAVRHHLSSLNGNASDEHVQLVLDYIKGHTDDPAHFEEISGFLEKLRPFMSVGLNGKAPATIEQATNTPDAESTAHESVDVARQL